MITRSKFAAAMLASLVIVGCTAAQTPVPTRAPATSAPPAATAATSVAPASVAPADIKVPKPANTTFTYGINTTPGFTDVPILVTVERLNKEGWNIKTVVLSSTELSVEALSKGDTNIMSAAVNTAMLAAQKGRPIILIGEKNVNHWTLVSKNEIAKCDDLNGKKVGTSTAGASNTLMYTAYIAANCPSAKPEQLILGDSQGRAQALLNGQIDATLLELADYVNVEGQAPGKFRILVNFSQVLSKLMANSTQANTTWLAANRDTATAFLAEQIKTNRMMTADPKLLEDATKRLVPALDAKIVADVVKAYLGINAFPPNGGISNARILETITFFTGKGLEPGLTVEKVADFGPIEAARKITGVIAGKD